MYKVFIAPPTGTEDYLITEPATVLQALNNGKLFAAMK